MTLSGAVCLLPSSIVKRPPLQLDKEDLSFLSLFSFFLFLFLMLSRKRLCRMQQGQLRTTTEECFRFCRGGRLRVNRLSGGNFKGRPPEIRSEATWPDSECVM